MKHDVFPPTWTVVVFVVALTLTLLGSALGADKETVLHVFRDKPASAPSSDLLFDGLGNLYGTTAVGGKGSCLDGCGVVFELSPTSNGSWMYTVLYVFKSYQDGAYPAGPLIFDSTGNLYGMTSMSMNCGTVFQLTPAAGEWTKTTIYDFGGGSPDGCEPRGGLVFDASGNLYGVTRSGGTNGSGTVFKLKPSVGGDWTESVIHSFAGGGSDGAYPLAGLAKDAAGNFYGTTFWGGTGNVGSVYELSPNSGGTWTESMLHSFSGNVAIPESKLWVDASGNLFGTASEDGEGGLGAAFELTRNSQGAWQQTVLHMFGGKLDGEYPYSDLFQDANGSLYGTTYIGGQGGAGTVYKLTPNSRGGWRFETLRSFSGKDGSAPYGGVIVDPAGNIYGTTEAGGLGYGVVFKIIQ